MAGLAGAFVASRVLWVVTLPRSAAYWEESYRYVAALELASHPVHPFMDYQADHYQGGSLVMIGILGALFRLLPPSFVLLKLAAILFSAGIAVLIYAVCAKLFDRTVAGISALSYLAGPPLLAYWGTVAMGSHAESIGFSFAQIGILGGLLAGEWRRPAGWLAFGLTAGLGAWFCYTAGMTTLACALAWLVLRGLPKPSELRAAAAGFALGLVPWAAYNLTHDFEGLGRVSEIFGGGDPIDHWSEIGAAEKLLQLIASDLPTGWLLPLGNDARPAIQHALELAYFVPFGLGLAWAAGRTLRAYAPRLRAVMRRNAAPASHPLARREEHASEHELAFILYAGVFVAVFLGSSFTIDPNASAVKYRILLPIAALLVPPAARSAELWMRTRGPRRIAATVGVALALLASASGTVLTATRAVPGTTTDPLVEGSATRGLLIHRKYETRPEAALPLLRAIPDPKARTLALSGVGWGMEYRYEADGDIRRIYNWLERVAPDERASLVSGIRFWSGVRVTELRKLIREGHGTEQEEKSAARLATLLGVLRAEPQSRTGASSSADGTR